MPSRQVGPGSAPDVRTPSGSDCSSQPVTPVTTQWSSPVCTTDQIASASTWPLGFGRSTSAKCAPASVDANSPTSVPTSTRLPCTPIARIPRTLAGSPLGAGYAPPSATGCDHVTPPSVVRAIRLPTVW